MGVGGRRESKIFFDMSKIYHVLDRTPCERSVDAMDGGRSVDGLDDTADGRNSDGEADVPVVPADS